jgi:hypothetical protein
VVAGVLGWDASWLLKLRAEVSVSGDIRKTLRPALHHVHKEATSALELDPPSVVNTPPPPSEHDLWSLATYAWPCGTLCNTSRFDKKDECANWWKQPHYKPEGKCDNATGLPWEQHDGYPADASPNTTVRALDTMSDAVVTLARGLPAQ